MIDIQREEVLTLADAAKILPRRKKGRKPHFSTLWRWSDRGLHGVRLECIKVGGTLCTSTQALQRFFDRLTELDGQDGSATPQGSLRSPAKRRRAYEAAERELEEGGY